jgi:hypothetical protein
MSNWGYNGLLAFFGFRNDAPIAPANEPPPDEPAAPIAPTNALINTVRPPSEDELSPAAKDRISAITQIMYAPRDGVLDSRTFNTTHLLPREDRRLLNRKRFQQNYNREKMKFEEEERIRKKQEQEEELEETLKEMARQRLNQELRDKNPINYKMTPIQFFDNK